MSDPLKRRADLQLDHARRRLVVVRRQYDRLQLLAAAQTVASNELDVAELALIDAEYAVALAALGAQEQS